MALNLTGIISREVGKVACVKYMVQAITWCRNIVKNPALLREWLAGERSSSDGQELVCRQLVLDQALWWDNWQPSKEREFHEGIWLNNFYKPAWGHAQLAAVNMHMGPRAPMSSSSLLHEPDLCRPVGHERGVTAETVSKLCQKGRLREAVEALGVLVHTDSCISTSLFHSVLKKCVGNKDLVLGRRVHALTVKMGYESDTFLCNHILRMYASFARLQEAVDVFTVVAKPNAFTWSSIISAHVRHGQARKAIQLYHQMRSSSVQPDGHVFVAALQACASGADLETGQQVHVDVLASGVEPHLFVFNCLLDMYAKCGSLEDAQRVFDGLPIKDVVTWTAMIAGYSRQGMGQEALRLYNDMQEDGMSAPDSVTLVCLLQACASVGVAALQKGKDIHVQVEEQGLLTETAVGNSLVNMYAKCGSLQDAQRVFDELRQKDVVTWTTMIAGYSQQGMGQEALRLYSGMQQEGRATPNSVTFVCLLQACASVGITAMEEGRQLHAQIIELGLQADLAVGGSLVNMYAKCGSLEDAQSVFYNLRQKGVVTWTAMIAGYSQQGMGQEALCLYNAMKREGIAAPNPVTFVCLLQACASVAALDLGRQLHAEIEEQGLQADLFVAHSLITMYAKSGSMVDAQRVFDALSERDIVAWNALIAGYTCQGDSQGVFDLVHRMREDGIHPNDVTFLSVLTVCSHAGQLNKGREYFEAMHRLYGITPGVEHYTCVVDLLGRAGQLDEALAVVRSMPVQPSEAMWHTLLGACRKWGNVEMGRHAFDEAVKLDKKDAAAYVLMFNIYTDAHMWEEAKEMQARRKKIRAWKQLGRSWWTDMGGRVHTFVVGDERHRKTRPYGTYLMMERKPICMGAARS